MSLRIEDILGHKKLFWWRFDPSLPNKTVACATVPRRTATVVHRSLGTPLATLWFCEEESSFAYNDMRNKKGTLWF